MPDKIRHKQISDVKGKSIYLMKESFRSLTLYA
jgi:hypothetical protein